VVTLQCSWRLKLFVLVVTLATLGGLRVSAQTVPPSTPEATPTVLTTVEPVYPTAALSDHIIGTVVVHAHIDEQGKVTGVEVISGDRVFHQAVIDAVKQWTFSPAKKNGKPVASVYQISITFAPPDPTPIPPTPSGSCNHIAILLHRIAPVYPKLKSAHKGKVALQVSIDDHGTVTDVKTLSGDQDFMTAATDAVRQWKYQPTFKDCKAVPSTTKVTILFNQ